MVDGERNYTYNVNDGKLINEKTKRQVKSVPMSKDAIYNALAYGGQQKNLVIMGLAHICNWYGKADMFNSQELCQAYDKFASIIPENANVCCIDTIKNIVFGNQLKLALQIVSEMVKNGENRFDFNDIRYQANLRKLQMEYPQLTAEFVREHYGVLETYAQHKYKDIFMYYYINQKCYALKGNYSISFPSIFDNYIGKCDIMGKEPIKTNNFMRELVETEMAFELWQRLDRETRWDGIKERYAQKVEFETDDFIVMLPPTAQDLVREGNEMHHCVGGYVDRIASGETLIVYVRKKSEPNKSYITAQINPRNMKLGQYYLAYDRTITEPKDIKFKELYQQFLYGNI